MNETTTPHWLKWAREIQSIGQIGLTYSNNEYDRQNYKRMMEISAEIVEQQSEFSKDEIYNNFLFLCS